MTTPSKIYQVEVFPDGAIGWRLNGVYHRDEGPAVTWVDGSEFYFRNGRFHRDDGPAVKYSDGTEKYFRNGKCHREDGPAVKWANGKEAYYLNGVLYSKEKFDKLILRRKKRAEKSLACENKKVIIEGVK